MVLRYHRINWCDYDMVIYDYHDHEDAFKENTCKLSESILDVKHSTLRFVCH